VRPNLSRIRSSKEHLSGGGIASGPVSRARLTLSARVKSGGTTRRAAKMVIPAAPDIEEFILCQATEEKKVLIDAGYNVVLQLPGGAMTG